jgi:hypothetical protein
MACFLSGLRTSPGTCKTSNLQTIYSKNLLQLHYVFTEQRTKSFLEPIPPEIKLIDGRQPLYVTMPFIHGTRVQFHTPESYNKIKFSSTIFNSN